MHPTAEKSHVSDISYKAYMGKTIICHTLTMSIMCTCTGVCYRTEDSLQYSYVHKELLNSRLIIAIVSGYCSKCTIIILFILNIL